MEAGKIKSYGVATYSCFRQKPTAHKQFLSLQKTEAIAQKVVGQDKKHNFKHIQVPINVMMPEAFVEPWQPFEKEGVSRNKLLAAVCADLNLNLTASQPLLQGQVANLPLSKFAVPRAHTLGARHLQLIRSIPSKALLSCVVGMKEPSHVRHNLQVIKGAPLTRQEFLDGIKPVKRTEFIEEELDY